MAIAQDEIFGPIAPIIKVKDEAEALRVANRTEYGLSSAVFTRDHERGVKFALRVEAGMTHVNDHTVNDAPTGPFGGEKNSGLGRFGGEWIDPARIHPRSLGNRAALRWPLPFLVSPTSSRHRRHRCCVVC
jgi:acyl-CoA reductase-like NAD-dependent aldehyde dehydrogenase